MRTLMTPRILLGALTPSGRTTVAAWCTGLPDAGESLAILPANHPPGEASRDPTGVLTYRVDFPAAGWLTIDSLSLSPAHRGRGYGSEAVRAVEEFAAERGLTHVLAEIDAGEGLGFYFWLRLGFRPARLTEIFWRDPNRDGTVAVIRRLL
jgi:GNAT superfamily N-acetyltransferase